MNKIIFAINENDGAPETAEVAKGLVAFNRSVQGPSNHKPFVISAKDQSGKLVGGVVGYTHWGWMFINHLWVSEEVKGQGIGSRLMAEAEALAKSRGCANAWLDTYSFQARPFYEKSGYKKFASLEDYPPGATRYFMKKKLSP